MNFNPNQPNPYLIQYDVHPQYASYRDTVIKTVMEIIQATSGTTQIRQWFYNVVSQNNWCNQHFKDTIEITLKYLVVTDITNPTARNYGNFLQSTCDGGIRLAIAFVIQQYPNENNAMSQFHNSNTTNLQTLNGVMNDYAAIMNGGMNQQPQYQQYQYPPNSIPVQGGFIPNSQPYYNNGPQFTQHQQYQYPQNAPSLAGPPQQNPSMGRYNNSPPTNQVMSRFGSLDIGQNDLQQYEPTPVTNQSRYYPNNQNNNVSQQYVDPVPEPAEVEEILTEKDWKSTPSQPYKTLCRRNQKAIYKRIDGVVTEIIVEKPEMERDKHAGKIKVCGKVFDPPNRDKFRRDVEEYCKITAEDIAERFANKPKKDILETVKESVAEENLQVPFLDAAITYGQIEQQAREDIEGTNVFKMYATIVKPVVTNSVEDNETIGKINKCNNIPEVVKVLRDETTKTVVEDDNLTNTLFCKEIDKNLANVINAFVLHSLSINTKIDSFVEDIYELLDYLKTDHGNLYAGAMDRFKSQLFSKGPFMDIPKDELDSIRGSLFNGIESEDTDTTISFIPSQYSITYVSSCSDELDMLINKDSKLISELGLPVLYGLAKSSFEHAKGMPTSVLRHLLVTRDNRVFEFHKGYLQDDSFLIREFSEKIDFS